MSVSCRNACYRKVPSVRVRGVPELAVCLVFTPNDPEVYTLNPSAWLVLRLCDGRSEAKIALAYHAAVEPMLSLDETRREVRVGIESLIQKRIIEVVNGRRTRSNPPRQEKSS
jgi:coenzyme PQQ synthesis protein D (PqqD)